MVQPQAPGKRPGMRVLLIEDDSTTARSIELMLKSENFNVYSTDLGEEGIDLGKIDDYDVILLDLNLPDMSGFDVLRKLRVSKVTFPAPCVTGVSRPQSEKPVASKTSLSNVPEDSVSGPIENTSPMLPVAA